MNTEFKNYKVFFFDLDGTLIDEKNDQISQKNQEAIAELKKIGQVVISTGRVGEDLNRFLDLLQTKYLVSSNGSVVSDREGNVYRDIKLSKDTLKELVEFAKQNNLTFKIDGQRIAYQFKSTFFSRLIIRKIGYQPESVTNFVINEKGVYKIILWGKRRGKIKKITQNLRLMFPNCAVVNSGKNFTIEITNIQGTKGLGNETVWKDILKVSKDQTVHFGDSMNDSTVIGHVGKFVAMKNSPKKLIELADYLGPKWKNGGIYKIVKENKLKKLK